MPLTGIELITRADLGGGTHVFPTRRVTAPAGTRGLHIVVFRNTDVSPTWFQPGVVVWQWIAPNSAVIGFASNQLRFDEGVAFIPPSSAWGNDYRATLVLREFLPPVTVEYSRLTD